MSAETPPVVATRAVLEELLELVERGDLTGLPALLAEMHPSDIADLLASVPSEDRRLEVLKALPTEVASETLAEMEEDEDRAELLAELGVRRGAELLQELADDDAADLLGELEPGDRDRILAALPSEEAGEIRELLRYDEETAGGLMTTSLVSVATTATAAQAIAEIREKGREVEEFYTVFVVGRGGLLEGTVPLDDLILADPGDTVRSLVVPVPATVFPDTDQEEVGRVMGRYNLVNIPVVNEEGALLGRITFDDVIDVIEAETTEDILRLAGVSDEEELKGGWLDSVRSRLPWLVLNLVTAGVAASVILRFEELISRFVFLAFLMPVIAALGGNTGTQALAVTIRRIAVGDELPGGRFQVVGKEVLVGLLNGFVLGLVFALFAYVYVPEDGLRIGVVVLLAMWANIVVAGFAGALIPTVLKRLGVDPAVASSVFVHTLTDLVGFIMVLSLAWGLLS
ncbi:MAG: magnesium transporter [Gemmatimonadota bacterium]|nr:magnesium transporter [Gemmatimonadota bacterium]MDE2983403.1 magnesium transporter [Gemmatimonadota bacterium]